MSRDDRTAVVACSVRRVTLVAGHSAGRPSVVFYRLSLVADESGRWLVADARLS